MMEKYKTPEMEIVMFEGEDIITTSGEEPEVDAGDLDNFNN